MSMKKRDSKHANLSPNASPAPSSGTAPLEVDVSLHEAVSTRRSSKRGSKKHRGKEDGTIKATSPRKECNDEGGSETTSKRSSKRSFRSKILAIADEQSSRSKRAASKLKSMFAKKPDDGESKRGHSKRSKKRRKSVKDRSVRDSTLKEQKDLNETSTPSRYTELPDVAASKRERQETCPTSNPTSSPPITSSSSPVPPTSTASSSAGPSSPSTPKNKITSPTTSSSPSSSQRGGKRESQIPPMKARNSLTESENAPTVFEEIAAPKRPADASAKKNNRLDMGGENTETEYATAVVRIDRTPTAIQLKSTSPMEKNDEKPK
ncbi:hypothetical protein L596_018626 [Steinernema carpocapsae]|uniref:Uncharacterized protein n=1 Tax=Steinernema carpocapsae TaxID=34508 RepID=A0A4U5N5Q0_STECR|nr:hypothetical protein L596_018626 [Steinernema carpocapsae]